LAANVQLPNLGLALVMYNAPPLPAILRHENNIESRHAKTTASKRTSRVSDKGTARKTGDATISDTYSTTGNCSSVSQQEPTQTGRTHVLGSGRNCTAKTWGCRFGRKPHHHYHHLPSCYRSSTEVDKAPETYLLCCWQRYSSKTLDYRYRQKQRHRVLFYCHVRCLKAEMTACRTYAQRSRQRRSSKSSRRRY
jgi:hypothetical protein